MFEPLPDLTVPAGWLPLAFGAWEIALVFSVANLAVLAWRLRLENASIDRRASKSLTIK